MLIVPNCGELLKINMNYTQQVDVIQKRISNFLNRHFVVASLVLVVALFIAQFVVLAAVGTQGTEVSRVRQEKDYYRIENERLRAEIDSVRTLSQIEEGLDEVFDLQAAKIKPVEVSNNLEDVGLDY